MLGTLLASVVLPLLPIASARAGNEPVIGVDVIIRSKADGRVIIETITDGRGAFVVKELWPGLYTIEAGAKLPLALLKRSGGWGIALIPVSIRPVQPQKHRAQPTAKGMQVDIVVPEGTTGSYTVIVTD
ncbi:MAG: hypothetical protein FD144_128 [Rhodospirillaceae bacterium]|nr:MAG: hypothetical protein FD144_128 [Rhodospirillaceae bacterium]